MIVNYASLVSKMHDFIHKNIVVVFLFFKEKEGENHEARIKSSK